MFACLKEFYLIVIDYTSNYLELTQLPNVSSDTVITRITSIFARLGISKVVFSDNGTQNSSYKFVKSLDIIHRTSSPEFPRNNGFCGETYSNH